MSFLNPKTTTTSNQQSQQTNNQTSNMFGGQQGYQQAIEPAYMSAFRQSLIPQFGQLYKQSQQPVYGDAQVGNFSSNLNTLANSSINQLKSQLARTGTLDSGRLAGGITDINLGNLQQQSQFLSQLPFLNKQFSLQAGSNLLGQGMNFAGRAPISGYNVGQTNQSGNQTGEQSGSMNGSQTQTGNFLNQLFGGLIGGATGAFTGGLSNLIGGKDWSGGWK